MFKEQYFTKANLGALLIGIVALVLNLYILYDYQNSYHKTVALTICLISLLCQLAITAVLRSQIGKSILFLSGISIYLGIFVVIDGLFMSLYARFFFNTILYFFAGIYMMFLTRRRLNYLEIFLLLFVAPLSLFCSALLLSSKIIVALDFTFFLVLIMLWLYAQIQRKKAFVIGAIIFTGILAFIVYPTYIEMNTAEEMQPKNLPQQIILGEQAAKK